MDRFMYFMSGLTDVYSMQLLGCQAEVHLSLCDTDVTAHDDSVYSLGDGEREERCVYKGLCDPSHLKTPMHLLLLFRPSQVHNPELDRKAFLCKRAISAQPLAKDMNMFCDHF